MESRKVPIVRILHCECNSVSGWMFVDTDTTEVTFVWIWNLSS